MSSKECINDVFIKNDQIIEVINFKDEFVFSGFSIYEVIRIIDGIPLFLEDHYERLINSLNLNNIEISISLNNLKQLINNLINANNKFIGNCKLVININFKNEKNLFLYFIKHYYPTENEYINGVRTHLYKAQRENPNSKSIFFDLRNKINEYISNNRIFEVLLVNSDNYITEGSRSNVFFIKEDKVLTPPITQILPGVTRKYINKICKENKVDLIERNIEINDLQFFTSAFLTGTSINVLPINSIDSIKMNTSNDLIKKISEAYIKKVNKYLSEKH
jgi:branched-chain amino acid aminotransferase